MKVLPSSTEAMELAATVIRDGGIVAHPTETCYGLACDLTNPDAVKKLFLIKHRPPTHPVSGLFASINEASHYVEWSMKAYELSRSHLPGPLTVVLWLRKDITTKLFPTPDGGDTLGVRISSHPIAHRLTVITGAPLSTTSANIHGQPNTYKVEEVISQFSLSDLQPDLIIDGGELPHMEPSTVIDLTHTKVKVVRQGNVTI